MKRLQVAGLLLVMFALLLPLTDIGAAESPSGKDIKAEWNFPEWLGTSPYSTVFEVKDTDKQVLPLRFGNQTDHHQGSD